MHLTRWKISESAFKITLDFWEICTHRQTNAFLTKIIRFVYFIKNSYLDCFYFNFITVIYRSKTFTLLIYFVTNIDKKLYYVTIHIIVKADWRKCIK